MASVALPTLTQRLRSAPALHLALGLAVALALGLLVARGTRVGAQVEGDRGILPVATSVDIEIAGIEVETTGKDAAEARLNGWKEAQRKAWEKAGGPSIPDGQLDSYVTAIVIEREQIGPRRYFARLSVIFDRARAGQFIGGSGTARSHSAPLLTIPVLHSGGVSQVYEVQGPWQRAWAEFRAGTSPIDYVRASGAGGDSLLITAGQPRRRSRAWWRTVLDQFGAADVIVPEARLERQWPGGPVRGTFTARYGPDNKFLQSFTMTANDEAAVPKMLAEAVVRLDAIYAAALDAGQLKPDQTLAAGVGTLDPALAALIAAAQAAEKAAAPTPTATSSAAATPTPTATPTVAVEVRSFTIQFSSPDAAAVDAALGAVRSTAGVQGASTTSLAMGGTSLMRVSYAGELQTLAAALRAKGWTVAVGTNALSIKR